VTETPTVLVTTDLARLRAVLELPPGSCRPLLYVPEAHQALEPDDDVVDVIRRAIERFESELGHPGAVVIATTAGIWQLR
jgi:hypothetical protein